MTPDELREHLDAEHEGWQNTLVPYNIIENGRVIGFSVSAIRGWVHREIHRREDAIAAERWEELRLPRLVGSLEAGRLYAEKVPADAARVELHFRETSAASNTFLRSLMETLQARGVQEVRVRGARADWVNALKWYARDGMTVKEWKA